MQYLDSPPVLHFLEMLHTTNLGFTPHTAGLDFQLGVWALRHTALTLFHVLQPVCCTSWIQAHMILHRTIPRDT